MAHDNSVYVASTSTDPASLALRVFLEDECNMPDGWVRVHWPDEAIDLLETKKVAEISLDHDFGNDQCGNGYDVVLWIEDAVAPTRVYSTEDECSLSKFFGPAKDGSWYSGD